MDPSKTLPCEPTMDVISENQPLTQRIQEIGAGLKLLEEAETSSSCL